MPDYYRKPVDKLVYQDGQKYVHENVFNLRITNLLGTIEEVQNAKKDHENFMLKLLDNKIISFLFAKAIRKQIEKYGNIETKF